MAFDPGLGKVLLFGGSGCPGSPVFACNDTWTYVHGNWTRLAAGHAPTPRYDSLMVYDPAENGTLLFGGWDPWESYANGSTIPTFVPNFSNETWLFRNGSWHNLTGGFAPPASLANSQVAGMVFDAIDGYVLLTGSRYGGAIHPMETWAFRSGAWTNLSVSPRGASFFYGLVVYDAFLGEVLATASEDSSGSWPVRSTTWWGLRAGGWSELTIPGQFAAPQDQAVYDPSAGVVVGIGGYRTGFTPSTTWELQGWNVTNTSTSSSPPGRLDAGMAYDPADGYTLLFGGLSFPRGVGVGSNDTWAYRPEGVAGPPVHFHAVLVNVQPASCGPILVEDIPVANGTWLQSPAGDYRLWAPPCRWETFVAWSVSGNLSLTSQPSDPNATVRFVANGTVSARFDPTALLLVQSRPWGCAPAIQINSLTAPLNRTMGLASNSRLSVDAGGCNLTGYAFSRWELSIAPYVSTLYNSTQPFVFILAVNTTLTAVYLPSTSPTPPFGSVPLVLVAAGAVVIIAVAGVLVLRFRHPKVPPTHLSRQS